MDCVGDFHGFFFFFPLLLLFNKTGNGLRKMLFG